MEEVEKLVLFVECNFCRKKFDFSDYLSMEDFGKHIAYLVREKCKGDTIICPDCLTSLNL